MREAAIIRVGIGTAAVLVAMTTAAPAKANGRFPKSNQILFSPTDPHLVIARTTYAILLSHDDGQSWRFLCEDALAVPLSTDPTLELTATGAMIAGLPQTAPALDVSTNGGCDWSCVGALGGQGIADMTIAPGPPERVLLLTSTYRSEDAGGGYASQVFETANDGQDWTALGAPFDTDVLVQTIDVTAVDPHRIYVSGTRGFGAGKTASLFESTDDAAHWTERPIPSFDPSSEDSVYIGAVDPADPDRVYLRSNAQANGGQSRLFVTKDAGQSFAVAQAFPVPPPPAGIILPPHGGELLGFALSQDGSRIYAGTAEQGLFVGSKTDLSFVKTSDIHVQCLATRGSELWACSDALSGFVIGVSTDKGATFGAKLPTITALAGPIDCAAVANGPLACGATANASQCVTSFNAFCELDDPSGTCSPVAQDAGAGPHAGGGDASLPPPGGDASSPLGTDASATPAHPPAQKSGCSCTLMGAQPMTASFAARSIAALLLGLAALGRRSRRRREGQRRV